MLASIVDVACSYSIIAPTRRSVVTVDLRVDYHRPGFGDRAVWHGERLVATIRKGRDGKQEVVRFDGAEGGAP